MGSKPPRLVPWPRAATAAQALVVFSLVSMSLSMLLLALLAHRIESSSECRFDREADVSEVNDRIDLWTARGLATTVRGDDVGTEEALQHIDELSDRFESMIVVRQEIAEECD